MKIKTRDAMRGTVRTLDRTVKVTGRGAGEAQRQASEAAQSDSRSENEYAGNQVQSIERTVTRAIIYGADRFGRWGMRHTAKKIRIIKKRKIKVRFTPSGQWKILIKKPIRTSKGRIQAIKRAAKISAKVFQIIAKAAVAAAKVVVSALKGKVVAYCGWIVIVVILLICIIGFVMGVVYQSSVIAYT